MVLAAIPLVADTARVAESNLGATASVFQPADLLPVGEESFRALAVR